MMLNSIYNKFGAYFSQVYEEEINMFKDEEFFHIMNGTKFWRNPKTQKLVDKGRVWICRHLTKDGFMSENLTVEPGDNEQFEIAVRFPHVEGHTHS